MQRQIVYPGAIPLETDLLNTNKYAMMGLAKLASLMMGSSTYLHGLACTPSTPASMIINIAPGQIYSLQNIDNTAYSSLDADTTHTILKQGVILDSTAFTLTAPTTAGQSINYLIQVTYTDVDSGATVLPYYNASNLSVAYSGPGNSGAAQNTVRSGVCTVAIKSGVAATTGTQTTPSVDTGYTAAWVITVPQGATSIAAVNISVAPNAPFLPAAGVFSAIQQGVMTYSADTGAANAYAASYLPNLPAMVDGMRLTFKAKAANTGASTLSVNGGVSYPLYSHAHQALQGGEIIANGLIEVEWNSSLSAWVLCGNSGGALPVAAATKSNHAPQFSQVLARENPFADIASDGADAIATALANLGLGDASGYVGRFLGFQVISASGAINKTPGAKKWDAIAIGAGAGAGAGGGFAISNANFNSASGGGGAGGMARKMIDVSSINSVIATIGIGGKGGIAATKTPGTNGGVTILGSYMSANGGNFGNSVVPSATSSSNIGAGNPGGTGVNGDINATGGAGLPGVATAPAVAGLSVGPGYGGSSFLSGPSGYGAGGNGAATTTGNQSLDGHDGSDGVILIMEYA